MLTAVPPSATRADSPPLWEQLAAGFVVAMLTGALIGPVFAPTQEETPILRLIWLPVYAIIAGLALVRAPRLVRAWPAFVAVGLLVGLCFASKYWSIDAATTQRRVIALAIASVFSVYLGAVFRGVALPRMLAWACLLMGLGSLVFVFAFPAIGVHHGDNDGLWRGLWYEKNQMGLVMVVGAVSAAAWIAAEERLPIAAVGAFLVSCLLVAATQSKTSLLCLMAALGVIGGLWAMRKGGAAFSVFAIWAAVLAAGAGVWLWESHSVAILEALGKDPSLTGRTDIWDSLMRRVAERPWTGYGYAAFWGRDSVPAAWVRQETQWPVPSAHNGWIDLLVQLGWPGLVVVAVIVAVTALAVVARIGGAGLREGGWSAGYLVAFIILSFSESVLLSHQNLPWVLFLAILTRHLMVEAAPVPLAASNRRAYQSRPRIVAHSAHGHVRRKAALAVR
jgi:exopolysaccharide production protein ExoQ